MSGVYTIGERWLFSSILLYRKTDNGFPRNIFDAAGMDIVKFPSFMNLYRESAEVAQANILPLLQGV